MKRFTLLTLVVLFMGAQTVLSQQGTKPQKSENGKPATAAKPTKPKTPAIPLSRFLLM